MTRNTKFVKVFITVVTMTTKKQIVLTLETLGLSTYEARAFLAALSEYPITGYKLSKLSGVPRSRIYETIEKLTAKGLIIVQPGDVTLVKPVKLDVFLSKKDEEHKKALEFLRESIEDFGQSVQDSGTWNISGRDRILEFLKEFITHAKSHIYVAGHAEDFLCLSLILEKTAAKGVRMEGVYCGEAADLPKWMQPHQGGLCDTCRDIAVSIDSSRALVGSTLPYDAATIVLTENRGIVHIVEEYIKHEIFITRMTLRDTAISTDGMKELYRQIMMTLP